jgi:uncharacterized membrane-anchored protein YhcB (DUF1043 family)
MIPWWWMIIALMVGAIVGVLLVAVGSANNEQKR